MKLIVEAPNMDALTDYLETVIVPQLAEGFTSGHHSPELHWATED